MKTICTIISLAAFGCACSTTNPDMQVTAPVELQPIINQFVADCKKTQPENICAPPIKLFVSVNPITDSNTIGQCTVYHKPFENYRVIQLEPETVDSYQLWLVLYHELFHCVLEKPHFDDDVDIMNTFERKETTEKIYPNWDIFVQRVFQRE